MSFIKEVSIGNNVYDIRDKNALNTSNISNCLLEIPQDIKLELVDGTLTLKAGSKVYVPNGFESDGTTPKFDVVTTTTDLNAAVSGNLEWFCFLNSDGTQVVSRGVSDSYSGTSDPGTAGTAYYLTNLNILHYRFANGTQVNASFPFCKITTTDDVVTSIDQVFNGFGYIGSTVFALPGVKGLIPNGRNADGSLKNKEFTTTSVSILYNTSSGDKEFTIANTNKLFSIYSKGYIKYFQDENKNRTTAGTFVGLTVTGTFTVDSTGRITSFTPKTTFHAVDRNDSSWLSGLGMPSSRYIDLTLGANGSTYTAPANGWFYICKKAGVVGSYLNIANDTKSFYYSLLGGSTGHDLTSLIVFEKGEICRIFYNATGDTVAFRFYYAVGENS